jgi:hypothetical protein
MQVQTSECLVVEEMNEGQLTANLFIRDVTILQSRRGYCVFGHQEQAAGLSSLADGY